MNATDLRRLAARVGLLRAQVALMESTERDGKQRRLLCRLSAFLADGERMVMEEARSAPIRVELEVET